MIVNKLKINILKLRRNMKFNLKTVCSISIAIIILFVIYKLANQTLYSLSQQNRLADNFIRDFNRYECKSFKRYGPFNPDPRIRVDG